MSIKMKGDTTQFREFLYNITQFSINYVFEFCRKMSDTRADAKYQCLNN